MPAAASVPAPAPAPAAGPGWTPLGPAPGAGVRGVGVLPFTTDSDAPPDAAPLQVGDDVYAIESHPSGWLRAFVAPPPPPTAAPNAPPQLVLGVLPASHVHLRPAAALPAPLPSSADASGASAPALPLPTLGASDETASAADEPLVDEIAAAVREWHSLLHAYMDAREYSLFTSVTAHITALLHIRRQLLARTLAPHELALLRRTAVWKLVRANMAQALDVIVRHPSTGQLIDVARQAQPPPPPHLLARSSHSYVHASAPSLSTGPDPDPAASSTPSYISGVRLFSLQAALAYADQDEVVAAEAVELLEASAPPPGGGGAFAPVLPAATGPASALNPWASSPPAAAASSAATAAASARSRSMSMAARAMGGHRNSLVPVTRPAGLLPSASGSTSSASTSTTPTPGSGPGATNSAAGSSDSGQGSQAQAQYFHVYMDVRTFAASPAAPGELVELYFSLYNRAEGTFLTEEFLVVLDHTGAPLTAATWANDQPHRDDYPPPPGLSMGGAAGGMKVLFTDLSPNDLSDLNLVCRIVRCGALRNPPGDVRTSLTGASAGHRPSNSPFTSNSGADGGSHLAPAEQRTRLTHMTAPNVFRRPFGAAVLELGTYHQFSLDASTSSPLRDHTMPILCPANESGFAYLHKDIIASRTKALENSSRADNVQVQIKVLYGDVPSLVRAHAALLADATRAARLGFPDVVFPGDQRNEAYLTLCTGEFAAALGAVGALNSLPMRNIQVSLEVRDRAGKRIEGAISRGAGAPAVSSYDTLVLPSNGAPVWDELVKLDLPDDRMEQCHLFFTIRNRVSTHEERGEDEPIAYAFLPLFEKSKAFIADGAHHLTIFRSSRHGASLSPELYFHVTPVLPPSMLPPGAAPVGVAGPSAAAPETDLVPPHIQSVLFPLAATGPHPRSHPPVPEAGVVVGDRDTLVVKTFLVSTRYTQNEWVLKLIHWNTELDNTQVEAQLRQVLAQFAFVGEVEIVKFLRDIFDALFAILVSSLNVGGGFDPILFNALVTVLGIVQDRRFMNFRATLDVYVEQHFRFTNVHVRLISSLLRLLHDPGQATTSKDLRASIKVWPYLFRFIVQSRENQKVSASCQIGAGAVNEHLEANFKHDLRQVLTGINRLMSTTKPSAIIGTQTLALQHFAGSYPDLLRVFSLEEMVQIATSFTDAAFITKGKMAIWKLLHILHLVSGVLFDHPASRAALIPAVVRWIRPHLGTFEAPPPGGPETEQTQAASDSARVIWLESATLAVSVLAVILDRLHVQIASLRSESSSPHAHSHATSAPTSASAADALAQELDNIDYLLSSLPPLLQTYQELASSETARTFERHRTPSTVPSSTPLIFPSTYPFALVARLPIVQHVPSAARAAHRHRSYSIASVRDTRDDQASAQPYLNCGLGSIAAVVNVLLVLSPTRHIAQFLEEQLDVSGPPAVTALIKEYCAVANSLLSHTAFPSSWLNVTVLTHQMVLKMLGPLADLLLARFVPIPPQGKPEEFDTCLWSAVLSLLMKLLASPLLAPEHFAPQRRRVVIHLAGDLRSQGGALLFRLWNALAASPTTPTSTPRDSAHMPRAQDDALATGGFQVQFIPSLVEPVVGLCLSAHDALRTCAVRILATMITSQWHFEGSFDVITAEMIDKLDAVFLASSTVPVGFGAGEESADSILFLTELRSLFDGGEVDPALRQTVHEALTSVGDFVALMVSVRALPPEPEFEDDHISGILKLLGFLRKFGRHSAFSTHVLHLVNLHLSRESWAEAALTLKLYADQLEWSITDQAPAAPELGLPTQTCFARKETLYLLMLDYLNRAQAWEIATDVCRELAGQYEYTSVNYARLSGLLVYQAGLFTRIATTERPVPSHFLVGYAGNAWPDSLRGQFFVYRGGSGSWDTLQSFSEGMQQFHPRANVVRSADPFGTLRSVDERTVIITPLEPEPDRTQQMFTSPEAPPFARAHREHSGMDTFSFTRPLRSAQPADLAGGSDLDGGSTPKMSVTDTALSWVEKTFVRCEDVFPTVIRRSLVEHTETIVVSPLENALDDLNRKTAELEALVHKYEAQAVGKPTTNRLAMELNAAVDAPVNGGIPMYKRTFFHPEYMAASPEKSSELQALRDAMDRQALVLYRGIRLHSALCPPEMRPFHQTLERFFRQNFADELTRLSLDMDLSPLAQPGMGLRTSLSDSTGSLPSLKAGSRNQLTREADLPQPRTIGSAQTPLQLHTEHLLRDIQHRGGVIFSAVPAADHSTLVSSPIVDDAATMGSTTQVLESSAPTSMFSSVQGHGQGQNQGQGQGQRPTTRPTRGATFGSSVLSAKAGSAHQRAGSMRTRQQRPGSTHTSRTGTSFDAHSAGGSTIEEAPPATRQGGDNGYTQAPEFVPTTYAQSLPVRQGPPPSSGSSKLWGGSSNRLSKLMMGRTKK